MFLLRGLSGWLCRVNIVLRSLLYVQKRSGARFSKGPGNFSVPELNFKIKIYRMVV